VVAPVGPGDASTGCSRTCSSRRPLIHRRSPCEYSKTGHRGAGLFRTSRRGRTVISRLVSLASSALHPETGMYRVRRRWPSDGDAAAVADEWLED